MAVASFRRVTVAASVTALLSVPSAVAAGAGALPSPAPPGAQPSPAPTGSLFLSTTVPAAGAPMFFLGMGYLPGEPVVAVLTGAGFAPRQHVEPPERPARPEHPEPAEHPVGAEKETRPPADEADSGPDRRLRRVVRADRLGVARGRLRLPARTHPGRYLFSLTGLTSHQRLYSFLTVRSRQGYAGTPAGNGAASAAGARPEAAAGAGPTPVSLVAAPLTGDVAPARPAGALTTAAIVAGGLAALGSGAWLLRRRRRERDWRA